MQDRSHPNIYWLRRGFGIHSEGNLPGGGLQRQREMRESFAKRGKTLDMGDWRVRCSQALRVTPAAWKGLGDPGGTPLQPHFQEEYREFLRKHGIEYDERFVWD